MIWAGCGLMKGCSSSSSICRLIDAILSRVKGNNPYFWCRQRSKRFRASSKLEWELQHSCNKDNKWSIWGIMHVITLVLKKSKHKNTQKDMLIMLVDSKGGTTFHIASQAGVFRGLVFRPSPQIKGRSKSSPINACVGGYFSCKLQKLTCTIFQNTLKI